MDKEYKIPSGAMVGFRESNAKDEGILTTQGFKEANTHITRYLAEIITSYNSKSVKLTYEQIAKWGLADKYYALLISRVINFGTELKFKWEFDDQKIETPQEEDLNLFLYKEHRLDNVEEDGPLAPKVYPNGMQQEFDFTTTTQKEFKVNVITTEGETVIALGDMQTISTLDIFKTRKLQYNLNGQGDWVTVQDFSFISSRESKELRDFINKVDIAFDAQVKVVHPTNASKSTYVPLIVIPDFLVP